MDHGALVGHSRSVLDLGSVSGCSIAELVAGVAGVDDRDEAVGLEYVAEPLVMGQARFHGVVDVAVVVVEVVVVD